MVCVAIEPDDSLSIYRSRSSLVAELAEAAFVHPVLEVVVCLDALEVIDRHAISGGREPRIHQCNDANSKSHYKLHVQSSIGAPWPLFFTCTAPT
jgi:hypothetical protein